MKRLNRHALYKLALLTVVFALVIPISGCSSKPKLTMVKGNDEPVKLIERKNSYSHPWSKIVEFLNQDKIDEEPYTREHDSVYFAEILHNRAEYNYIKTAFVVVEFENGEKYALNAFETVDYGIVYVDCTGKGRWDIQAFNFDFGIPINLPDFGLLSFYWGAKQADFSMNMDDYLRMTPKYREVYDTNLRNVSWEVRFPQRSCWDKRVDLKVGQKLSFRAISGVPENSSVDGLEKLIDKWEDIGKAFIVNLNYFDEFVEHVHNSEYKYYDDTFINPLNIIAGFNKQYRSDLETLALKIKDAYLNSWEESDSQVKSLKLYW